MPHQCVRCSKIIPIGSKEILEGCEACGNRFFFYIKDEQLKKMEENPIQMEEENQDKMEKDIRDMAGITEEDTPVILDIESVRAVGPGKYEIDVVNLFRKDRPLIYKVNEGKYIIDLSSTLNKNLKDVKEIRDPEEVKE